MSELNHLKDENLDWAMDKLLRDNGKLSTVMVDIDDDRGKGKYTSTELDLVEHKLGWFWTLASNAHCFGPFPSRLHALSNCLEEG